MKRLLFTFLVLGLVYTNLFSAPVDNSDFYPSPVVKDRVFINVGAGIFSSNIPLYGGFDYAITDDLTLGGELGFLFSDRVALGVTGNINYHFNRIFKLDPSWDLYAGANLNTYFFGAPIGINVGAQAGGRYFFSPTTAIHLELGGNNYSLGMKLGLTFIL